MSKVSAGEGLLAPSNLQYNIGEMKRKYTDITAQYEEQFIYSETEVGIKHTRGRSHLKFFDNGDIQMFSGIGSTGLIISKKYQSFNIFGEAVNIKSPRIRFSTESNGLVWNGYSMNPLLYEYSDRKNPEFWVEDREYPLPGPSYLDDLKLSGTVRWWCPGVPNLCGKIQKKGETHSGHWIRKDVAITPFKWLREDKEYKAMLEELGIPT